MMKPLIETGSDRFIVVSKSLGGPAFYEAIIAQIPASRGNKFRVCCRPGLRKRRRSNPDCSPYKLLAPQGFARQRRPRVSQSDPLLRACPPKTRSAPGCVSVRTLANSKRRLRARLNAKCAGANTARKSSSLPAPMPRLAQATRRRGTRAIRCPFRSAGFTRALGRVRLYASSDSARSARGSI
jgi:hypothetical protein